MPPRAIVITASTRGAAGLTQDRSGPLLAEGLRDLGLAVEGPILVSDGEPLAAALADALRDSPAVIVTTGGTGLTPTDLTPEMTRRVIDREVPGLAEAIRAYGREQGIATASLSRGLAGVAGRTLVINLPGSTGGVRDGLAVLRDVIGHAIEQVQGAGHREGDPGARD